jgi:hypothetical protein
MDNKELAKVKLDAEDWLTRSAQDRAYEGSAMPEAQANRMAETMLKLADKLAKLVPVLQAFRESDHSFDRAPTAEGQAVLDTWDEVAQALSPVRK